MAERLHVLVGDITRLRVDAIVNAANESLLGGGGVDGAIHRAAGPQLLTRCRALGGCPTGQARMTAGFRLPARHIIHTVGPVWRDGTRGEPGMLASCYRSVLQLVREHGLRSVAFPAISCGVYAYPPAAAAAIAVAECRRALAQDPHLEAVYLVAFDNAMAETLRRACGQQPSAILPAPAHHQITNPMKIETLAVHGGYAPDPTTKAVAVPIYQTTSYAFDDTQHGADLFDLKVPGNIYTRIMNPTTDVLEKRLAALEGGIGGLGLASGMAAITYAIQTIAESGDNIVSTSTLYGGTYNLFAHTLPQYGIEVRFADYRDPQAFAKLIDGRTKAVFCESIGNPLGNVVDLGAMAQVAHRHGVPLIVDNTVPTPYLCRPFEHGADIVVHALTKYLGGHGNSIGGVIVDSGKFPWAEHKARFKRLNEPDVSYHGVVYTEALGPAAYIGRARVVPLRNMGAAISPFNSFLILQGIETLAVRMDRICDNTLAVANYLAGHVKVGWVRYAGLPEHAEKPLVDKYMGGRASGILSFGVNGGAAGGARFIDALKLVTRLVNIGDAKSLACHPATTTHRQLAAEEMEKAGVSADMVRLSIGIEHIDDILADLQQALGAV